MSRKKFVATAPDDLVLPEPTRVPPPVDREAFVPLNGKEHFGTPALLMLVHCSECNRPFEVRFSNAGKCELIHDRNTGCGFDGKRFAPPVIKLEEIK